MKKSLLILLFSFSTISNCQDSIESHSLVLTDKTKDKEFHVREAADVKVLYNGSSSADGQLYFLNDSTITIGATNISIHSIDEIWTVKRFTKYYGRS